MTSLDADKIKTEYGSLKAWAARLKVPYTTAHAWLRAGNEPPAWRHEKIVEAAQQDGKDIFVKAPKKRARAA